jgi:molybdopterin synthase sulfur carrier subunit
MSIRILYFALVRDALGRSEDRFENPSGPLTVVELRSQLSSRPDGMALASCKNLRCAVNQVMAGDDVMVCDGDEVAFFPPVTGG